MGGIGGGREGGGSTPFALARDDVDPPLLLDIGKSAPPTIYVSLRKIPTSFSVTHDQYRLTNAQSRQLHAQ